MGVTMPLAIFNLNMPELLVIGLVGILLFGRRLPEMGKSLGKTIVEFKKGLNSTGDDLNKAINEDPEPQPSRRVEARPARPVKQIAGGQFSTWANAHLAVGHVIDVMPPHGSFTHAFDPDARRTYVGFAGGSGITPVLSLLKTALTVEPGSEFVLLYGNRSSGSIMFLEELAQLKNRFMGRLQIYHFLEEEEEEIALFNGRLDSAKIAEVLESLVDPQAIDLAFICGPGPMMDAVEQGLVAAGVAPERILIERFTVGRISDAEAAAARQVAEEAAGRTVKLTLEGRTRLVRFDAAKGSILENARAAGLPAPFACKAGVCATCRARLVQGEVTMKANYGLSAEEVAQGYVLTCQAVPLTDDVVLDYDA